MQSQSDSPDKPTNSLSQLVQNMFSNNNSNIMLAAIVSLLLVILFVLLLHMYAKLFLAPAPSRRRRQLRRTPVTLAPSRFHFPNMEESPISTKGLDSSIVSRIPMFVYETEAEELECVICLSGFEEGEIGRRLPKCGHAFHVECIDMWLSSHCNCPLCRAPIVVQYDDGDGDDDPGVLDIVIGTPSYEISESESGNDNNYGGGGGVSSVTVSQTSSSNLLGSSLKRMLSKVFQPSNVNELHGSQ